MKSLSDRFVAYTRSRAFTILLAAVGSLFIAAILFNAGVQVGFRQAQFAGHLGDSYRRSFGPMGQGGPLPQNLPNSHGVVGKVVSYEDSLLTILPPDKPEQMVRIATSTHIRAGAMEGESQALTVGSYVVVFGTPDTDGIVTATLVRIMPPPPTR